MLMMHLETVLEKIEILKEEPWQQNTIIMIIIIIRDPENNLSTINNCCLVS